MVIGYEQGITIAKCVYTERRSVPGIAEEVTDLGRAEREAMLVPAVLATNKNLFDLLIVVPRWYFLLTTAR